MSYAFTICVTMIVCGCIDEDAKGGPSGFLGFIGLVLTFAVYAGKTYL